MAPTEESNVDVLIVGAGPAGLMATLWMSRLGIKSRTVDKRGTKVFNGQADGLQPRTLEVFDSFGFLHNIIAPAQPFHEMASWGPNDKGIIERKERFIEGFSGMSRFTEYVLNQGYIEKYILESISEHSDLSVERGVLPSEISVDEAKAKDLSAYPVTVKLQHLSEEEAEPHQCKAHTKNGEVQDGLYRSNLSGDDTSHLIDTAVSKGRYSEVVHAKYVIGCDGAHSWTRQQLGLKMEGESTDYVWGVLDVIPITDFPDIRRPSTVQSPNGSMLLIPREKKLVRLYVQMNEVRPDDTGAVDRSRVNPDTILKAAQKIFAPYKLDYVYCDWWTAYQVGQRVGTGFCDPHHRVFLAGDAVHTHSPKAGQGMNVSMHDTYNLGWKMGGVLNGWLPREVLETYQPERRALAHRLIELDHKLSRVFSGTPTKNELLAMYRENMLFMSGFGIRYAPSFLVGAPAESKEPVEPLRAADESPLPQSPRKAKPEYTKKIELGESLQCSTVFAHADTCPWDLNQLLTSDGRWRLIIFAGDVSEKSRMEKLSEIGERLTRKGGLIERYLVSRPRQYIKNAPNRFKRESLVDVLVLHTSDVGDVEITSFHKAFLPFDEEEGHHYYKIFVDETIKGKLGGKAYEFYGVDAEQGAMVVTRPDQYIGFVTGLDGLDDVEGFFDGILLRQDGKSSHVNGSSGENGDNKA